MQNHFGKGRQSGFDSSLEEIFPVSTFITRFPSYFENVRGGCFMLHQEIHGERYVTKNIRHIFVPIFDNLHWHLVIVSMIDRTMMHMTTSKALKSPKMEYDIVVIPTNYFTYRDIS